VSSTPVEGFPTQFSFLVGDAATVVLDSANGTLRIAAFAPHPGWFTVQLAQPTLSELDVILESSGGQLHFIARIVDGAIVTELTPGPATASSVPGGSAPSTSGPDNSATSSSGPDDGGGNSGPGGGGSGEG
jgi:hypothetical protein